MKYRNVVIGKFIDRPNRFIAHVEYEGKSVTVHVKNTGRCKELLLPNVEVALAKTDNPQRKTQYDLIAVYKDNLGWVNIDSQVPNVVVKEWIESGAFLPSIITVKPEYTYKDSRIDFYIEAENRKILMEVKGCTQEFDGIGYFPDAPTQRGVKHLKELQKAVDEGYECYLTFVIAMPKVENVYPNMEIHREFGEELERAKAKGVKVLMLQCDVDYDRISIK